MNWKVDTLAKIVFFLIILAIAGLAGFLIDSWKTTIGVGLLFMAINMLDELDT